MKLTLGLALALTSTAAIATAEPPPSIRLDGDLVLELSGRSLVVRDGKRSTPLHDASAVTDAKVDRAKRTVTIATDVPETVRCGVGGTETFGFDELRAKIENRYAYARHVKKDYAAAAAGYAKAIALDPTWRIPAYNLAGVRTDLGDLAGAVAALAPWLKAEPIRTYLHVTDDKELRPLLARPELAAIVARQPTAPMARLRGAAYSAALGLVAVPQATGEFMQCQAITRVKLHEAATDKYVGEVPASGDGGCEQIPGGGPFFFHARSPDALLGADAAAILGKLGFAPVAIETSAAPQGGDKWTAYFPTAKLGVVLKDRKLNVLQGNRSLGVGDGLWKLAPSLYLPDQRLVIAHTFEQGMETCGEDPHRAITVIKLK
jgi:hypothetical protein